MPSFIGLKLLNIFSIGCIGSAQMFLPMYCKTVLGLGTDKIGAIYSITPFVSCIALPFWTSAIDRTMAYKRIMVINMLTAFSFVSFISIAPSLAAHEWAMISIVCLGTFGYAFFGYPVIVAMVDSVVLRVLNVRKEQLYGQQKAGCPIGFGASVFLTGLLTEAYGAHALFWVFGFNIAGFILTCAFTDFSPYPWPEEHRTTVDQVRTVARNHSMWELVKDREMARFLVVMGLTGFCVAVIQAFLFLFIETDLHGSPALVGLLGPLGSSTEVVCFLFAKDIFRWLGPRKMLIVAQLIIIGRCLVYVMSSHLAQGAVIATWVQLSHGIAFSLILCAGVVHSDSNAPEGLKSRAQGLFNMVFSGLGAGLGALFGGFVYEHYGANVMWSCVIFLLLVSLGLYTLPNKRAMAAGYVAIPK